MIFYILPSHTLSYISELYPHHYTYLSGLTDMGGGHSYLYIDLDKHGEKYHHNHYNIKFQESNFSNDYEVKKYTIEFIGDYKTYSWLNRDRYYLYLRFEQGKDPFFTYYVSRAHHVLKGVEFYYSKQHRTFPLIIGFVTSDARQYYSLFYLTRIKSSYGFPPEHFSSYEVSSKLIEEDNISNRIKLILEPHKNQNYRLQTSRPTRDFKKYSYTPKPRNINESFAVSKEVLFWLDRNIDYSFLYPYNLKYFDSINVYYSNANTALFVLLINNASKTGFSRKDKNGFWWQRIDGVDENSLDRRIKEALSDYVKNTSFLFILDRKVGYNNVTVYGEDLLAKYYTIYNHHPIKQASASNPILLLNGDKIKVTNDKTYSRVDGITTYFLKNKDGLEDTTPFLIVVEEFVGGSAQFTYYSKNSYEEENWIKLPVSDEIDEVLRKIGSTPPITERFYRLRNQAFFQIKNLKIQPTIKPDVVSGRDGSYSSKPPPGALPRSSDGRGGSSSQLTRVQRPRPRPRPAPRPTIQPAKETPPEPGSVQRLEVPVESKYEKAHAPEEASARKASPSPSRATSSSTSTLTQSRQSGTNDLRTSGHTESGSSVSTGQGHEAKAKSPQLPTQKAQDLPAPPSPPATPPRAHVQTAAPSHGGHTDLRGEKGTRSHDTHTQYEEPPGLRVDQETHSSVENRLIDQSLTRSSSPLKPLSEKQTHDKQKDDDQTATNIKIVGGVATTAIGAGSIGAGGYYANGVISLMQWLV
ncbi:hypothetical protein TOT_030000762 [Theileria orientalis strain Shintoku]|uniref:Uncharacterized protein n=1 Tax=Theileria orientalis strain Shintoku TaxID=869250 RepID=J4D9N6_THEOR|nr:hypothetical protein TOT_030000762 [Theileria orientalis strain Shintoku]BAM41500.1 hypothetical protein TOT_030000762 [Theileria orientalis strain Shintoku]|eukprot:XP_009691801.1 hypothetical protein TOT_030000762 [Theileria orientalis strain Shintoku]